ncbi:MAG: NAD(P)/FAD-dependent oxidoreductase, partial [Akkermansiaceae bacterium]
MPHLLVIGGGPAGLRAAEVASGTGAKVTLCDQKRSVGRKFLVAGKGGLNLTHSEELETFVTRYEGPDQPDDFWPRALADFDNKAIRAWAARLDVGTFVQKSGRVYPKALKAAPLLRRWVEKLRTQGVEFRMSHRLASLKSGE